MPDIETLFHLTATLIPTVGALAFVLLYRRQSIRADFDQKQLERLHCERVGRSQTERTKAVMATAQSYAPVLLMTIQRMLDRREDDDAAEPGPPPPEDFAGYDGPVVDLEDLIRLHREADAQAEEPAPFSPEPKAEGN